jgi:hypothetical protein
MMLGQMPTITTVCFPRGSVRHVWIPLARLDSPVSSRLIPRSFPSGFSAEWLTASLGICCGYSSFRRHASGLGGFRVASSWKFRRCFSLFGRRVSNELRRAAYDDDVSALLLLLLLATERDDRGGDASSTTTTTTTRGP